MRPWIVISILLGLLPMADAAIVEEWSLSFTVVASGELDGSPGLELVVDDAGQLSILDAATTAKEYDFPSGWSGFAAPVFWIRDVDQDGAGELVIALQSSPQVGLFRYDGSKFVEAWSIPGLAPDAVEFANMTGSSDLEVLLDFGPLQIVDALSGSTLYDSTNSIGLQSLISLEVADWGGDGLADALAGFNNGMLYLISDDTAVGIAGSSTLRLYQNRPNPAFASTKISFALSEPSRVRLRIYDAAGRLVRELLDERFPAGRHDVDWNGKDQQEQRVARGVYYYELEAGGRRQSRKMLRLNSM